MELPIDVVFINDECFLHSVDSTIKLKSLPVLRKMYKSESYDKNLVFKGLYEGLQHYKNADIYITRIQADN